MSHDAIAASSPAEAIAHLTALPDGAPVLVDLDQTLLLESSSELFLDSLRPAGFARLLLWSLDLLKPWRLWGGERQRDTWRVCIAVCCYPWALRRWRKLAPAIARRHVNHALLAALENCSVTVVSYGFVPLAAPLVSTLLPKAQLVACRLGFADRKRTKSALLAEANIGVSPAEATVVTDSLDDADLLQASPKPLLVRWPGCLVQPALSWVYLPLYYCERIRRPGQRHFFLAVLQGEFAITVLGAVWLCDAPLWLVPGLFLLCLSFWALYDVGYADNDQLSETFETQHLRRRTPVQIRYGTPWLAASLWSAGFALPGIYLIDQATGLGMQVVAIRWAVVLALSMAIYLLYNRLARPARVQWFGLLHISRTFALAAMVPVVMPTIFLLLALLYARHLEEVLRKTVDRQRFATFPRLFSTTLVWYLVAVLAFAATQPRTPYYWHGALLMAGYMALRARREWPGVISDLRWLWRYDDHQLHPLVAAERPQKTGDTP